MRNSRDAVGAQLHFDHEAIRALILGIKAGEFDDFGQ